MTRTPWPPHALSALGLMPDAAIVAIMAAAGVTISVRSVGLARKRLGIPAWRKSANFEQSRASRKRKPKRDDASGADNGR